MVSRSPVPATTGTLTLSSHIIMGAPATLYTHKLDIIILSNYSRENISITLQRLSIYVVHRSYVENLANCTCDKMNINLCLLGFLPFLPLSESLSGFSHYTLQTDRPISVCQTPSCLAIISQVLPSFPHVCCKHYPQNHCH